MARLKSDPVSLDLVKGTSSLAETQFHHWVNGLKNVKILGRLEKVKRPTVTNDMKLSEYFFFFSDIENRKGTTWSEYYGFSHSGASNILCIPLGIQVILCVPLDMIYGYVGQMFNSYTVSYIFFNNYCATENSMHGTHEILLLILP